MSHFDLRTRESRRSFIRKASYVAPAVLTLNAIPAFASQGSARGDDVDDHIQPPFDSGPHPPYDPGPPPQSDSGPQPPGDSLLPPPSHPAIGDAPQGGGRSSQTGWGG